MISFSFPPRGWAFCNGQLLSILQNQAVYSLLGVTYGGNGQTTFALPDLRGRAPVHVGPSVILGQRGGEEIHTLTLPELPNHNHMVLASTADASQRTPVQNVWTQQGTAAYGTVPSGSLNPTAIGQTGGSQPHINMQPYLTINYVICLQGMYPLP